MNAIRIIDLNTRHMAKPYKRCIIPSNDSTPTTGGRKALNALTLHFDRVIVRRGSPVVTLYRDDKRYKVHSSLITGIPTNLKHNDAINVPNKFIGVLCPKTIKQVSLASLK